MKIHTGKEKGIKSSIPKVLKNREVLSNIIGQRNIPFKGHNWDPFDLFVHWLAENKPVLQAHLKM
jgi:hypothetical protein